MRAWPHTTAMSERPLRAWGWRPGHAWGLSCKLPETLRGQPYTAPCAHSMALTSKRIGRWGFLCRLDVDRCAIPFGDRVSLVSGTPCAHGLTQLVCDPDRIVHTPPPYLRVGFIPFACLYISSGTSIERGGPKKFLVRMVRSECCSIRGEPFIPRLGLGPILFCPCVHTTLVPLPNAGTFEVWLQLWDVGGQWTKYFGLKLVTGQCARLRDRCGPVRSQPK